jgi:hypothetical protein
MKHQRWKATGFAFAIGLTFLSPAAQGGQESASEGSASVNQVLEWNRIFVESLIATNAVNSSQSAARSDRSYGYLRRLERSNGATHQSLFTARLRAARHAGPRSSLPRTRGFTCCCFSGGGGCICL